MYFENVIGNMIQNIHLFQDDKVKENVHYLDNDLLLVTI